MCIDWIFSSMLSIPETDQNVSEHTFSSAILNLEMSVCNEPLFFCLKLCSKCIWLQNYFVLKNTAFSTWTPLCFWNLKTVSEKIQCRNCLLDCLMNWQERVQSMMRHNCFLQKTLPRKSLITGVHSLVALLRGWSILGEGNIHRFNLSLDNLCTSHLV